MNSIISKVLITAVAVSADETIEHVNKVLFLSNMFFIGLDIIIFFVPIYILAKIVKRRNAQSKSDAEQESQIFKTEQKSDANDSSYFDSPFEE